MSLIIWVAAGLFVTFGSFVYIELGLLLSLSGGDYSYIFEAFGGFAGFMRLWVEAIVVRPCTATIVALTFSQYILVAFRGGNVNDYPALYIGVAAFMLVFQTFINCISVKASVWVNNVCTIAKVLALTVVIGIGAYALIVGTPGAYDNFADPFAGSQYNPGSIAVGFYSALFAYQGWNYLNFIIEEVKNPEVVLPRAVLISVFTVIAIYVLCNIAFFTALSPAELLSSSAAAIVSFLSRRTSNEGDFRTLHTRSQDGKPPELLFLSSSLFHASDLVTELFLLLADSSSSVLEMDTCLDSSS